MNKSQRAKKSAKAKRNKVFTQVSYSDAKKDREGTYQRDRPRSSKRQWWLTVS